MFLLFIYFKAMYTCSVLFEKKLKIYKLTCVATLFSNALNAGEDLFVSSCVKFCCKLNPSLIVGSGGGAAVVVVVGAPVVVIFGGADVPVTGGELRLA